MSNNGNVYRTALCWSLSVGVFILSLVAISNIVFYLLVQTPVTVNLGCNYVANNEVSEISVNGRMISFDSYYNMDNYIVVKKTYDNTEIVHYWPSDNQTAICRDSLGCEASDPVAMIEGKTYYYIINKCTNELIGPFEYDAFIEVCSDMGINLF